MYRLFGFVVVMVTMTGCASTGQGVREDFALQPGSDTGLVVLSTRLIDDCAQVLAPGERMAAINLNYLGTNGKGAGFFILKNFLMSNDFKNPDGYFYIRDLPAGSYKLYGFERAGVSFDRSHGDFDKPLTFQVKAGAVRYLGEVTVHIGKCEDKMKIAQRAVFEVSDQRQRDAALFDARMKRLNSKSFEYAILGK